MGNVVVAKVVAKAEALVAKVVAAAGAVCWVEDTMEMRVAVVAHMEVMEVVAMTEAKTVVARVVALRVATMGEEVMVVLMVVATAEEATVVVATVAHRVVEDAVEELRAVDARVEAVMAVEVREAEMMAVAAEPEAVVAVPVAAVPVVPKEAMDGAGATVVAKAETMGSGATSTPSLRLCSSSHGRRCGSSRNGVHSYQGYSARRMAPRRVVSCSRGRNFGQNCQSRCQAIPQSWSQSLHSARCDRRRRHMQYLNGCSPAPRSIHRSHRLSRLLFGYRRP